MPRTDFITFPSGLRLNRRTLNVRYYKPYDFEAIDGTRCTGVRFDVGRGPEATDNMTIAEFEALVFGEPERPWYRCRYEGGLFGRYAR